MVIYGNALLLLSRRQNYSMLRWQASLALTLGPDSLSARSSLESHKHRKPVGGITQKGQGLSVATEQGGVDMGT